VTRFCGCRYADSSMIGNTSRVPLRHGPVVRIDVKLE
jgi:hypothetical protein